MAFKFSDIVIPFKAQVSDAILGIKLLQSQLRDFVRSADAAQMRITTAVNTASGLDKKGNPLKELDNSSLRVLDRMTRFLTAISAVKSSLDLVFGESSNISKGFEAMGEGLRVFLNLAQLATDNFGQIAASAAGLVATAVFFLTAITEAEIKATEAATNQTIKSQKALTHFKESVADAVHVGQIFNDTYGEQASHALQANRSAYEDTLRKIRDLTAEKKKLSDAVRAEQSRLTNFQDNPISSFFLFPFAKKIENPTSPILKTLVDQANAAQAALDGLEKQNEDIARKANFLRLADQVGKFSTKLRDLALELNLLRAAAPALLHIAEALQPGAEFGKNLPEAQRVESAKAEFKIREQILQNLLKELEGNKELLVVLKAAEAFHQTKGGQAEIERLQNAIKSATLGTQSAEGDLLKAQREVNIAIAPEKFTQAFTIPLSHAIGDAVINGILEGKKGMEILADFTKNLLKNALEDVMKRFQQGMIDVFKEIAGAGGELLGAALTTVIGVVAGVLGRRASSTDSFEKIKNQIESSQLVRGVIGGPANVAIAAVGDNLKRALIGVEQRLDILIQVSSQIRDRTGGVPFAGSVPTV